MEIDSSAAWDRFLAGHWQKEMPNKPGAYPTADRDGLQNGYDRVVIYRDPKSGELVTLLPGGRYNWAGWWWSEPIPELPKPPPWSTNE